MSLLLDALKKAAEQKAEKSKETSSEGRPSDETVIDVASEDLSELEADAASNLRQTRREAQDETEFDTRHQPARVERDADEETNLDVDDETATRMRDPSTQLQTGEDETIVFADEDVSEFLGEPQFISRETRSQEDETDLSQLATQDEETGFDRAASQREDETDLSQLATQDEETGFDRAASLREDETELSQLAPQDEETDIGRAAPTREDETDLSHLAAQVDETAIGRVTPPREDETDLSQLARGEDETDFRQQLDAEDETDISEPLPPTHAIDQGKLEPAASAEDTDLSRVGAADGEQTDLSRVGAADSEETDLSQASINAPRADDTSTTPQEDMSLLLVEQDPTGLTAPTSVTDPNIPAAAGVVPDTDDDDFALVDTTRHHVPADQTETTGPSSTRTSATATTGVALDTLTTEGTTTRADSTSTRTYAPDNYDRTLMKLPSEDASKLFAGMKSDADVVMTPDYAKKVFLSKSSAQRVQHYKFYSGIFIVILLAISIYGAFEYQEESFNIDTSLMPLKRDPMPGIIKPGDLEKSTSLFNDELVDEKTIELIKNAGNDETAMVADEGVIASAGEPEAADQAAVVQSTTRTTAQTENLPSTQTGTATGDQGFVEIARIDSDPEPQQASGGSSNLELVSISKIAEKDIWLREAYAAYQAGDDERALELYNRVLEVDPANRNALLARAAISVHNGDSAAAIGDYQKLLLVNPKDSLAMASLLSVTRLSPRETESRLKLMIRDEPDSPYLNFALANVYGAQNRWREAQGHYYTALQNNPDDPNYAYNLAVSLEHISKPRVAIAYYQRALDNFNKGLATFNRDLVDQRLQMLSKL